MTLNQRGEEDGEIELLNVDYSTKRFAFSYAWWTAYGFKRHCNPADMDVCMLCMSARPSHNHQFVSRASDRFDVLAAGGEFDAADRPVGRVRGVW